MDFHSVYTRLTGAPRGVAELGNMFTNFFRRQLARNDGRVSETHRTGAGGRIGAFNTGAARDDLHHDSGVQLMYLFYNGNELGNKIVALE